mgnify:FL=1
MKKIIAILLCISALFALGACGRLTEAKSESVKPEVYFTEDKSGTYTDSVGNVYNYLIKIPAFSGGSEDAERINKYFDDALRPIVEDELAAMEDELSLMTGEKCEVFESGDVTSVLVSVYYPNDYIQYYTASMNTRENREMNNADIAAAYGIDEVDLPDKLREEATAAVEEYYADFGDISGDGFADVTGTRDETLAVIGSDEWEPTLFINGEGKVCMISEVMSPVGRYNQIFVL